MEWKFSDYLLSRERAELTGPDGPVHVEKQALDLLLFLVENAQRVVTKDEIIEAVWEGRFVSDSTVSTAVKLARRAVGDTGATQHTIKTIHGRGFRFVAALEPDMPANVLPASPVPTAAPAPLPAPVGTQKASIAVLRFQSLGTDPGGPALAQAFPGEIIANLSRLRWLRIIARASSFRFDPVTATPEDIAAQLSVRYILTGCVEAVGSTIITSVELLAAHDGALVWSDRFASKLSEVHAARQRVVAEVVTALELHIPRFEAEHARLLSPDQFDAWSHYHLGLRHIYRFSAADNEVAARHFETAMSLDPEFSRAHAGMSFTFWQKAFMQFGDDRNGLLDQATEHAHRALEIDTADAFASFNMGRARWLQGDLDAGFDWLDRALQINPNYAQCHYTLGLNKVFVGEFDSARSATDTAISLSPLDPLLYGMYGAQAMSHIGDEDFGEAKRLAGAHFYMMMIAAASCDLGGDRKGAERWRDQARASKPDATSAMFFKAFPFREAAMRRKMQGALDRLGFA